MQGQAEFIPFPKISRLSRDIIITEKIDGTNAQIYIADDGTVFAGSRTRWITPQQDNYGFARWVEANKEQLAKELGFGRHYGEWWGQGIQRGYGLKEKRFSLFNVTRWKDVPLALCGVVPTLYEGPFTTNPIEGVLDRLRVEGSIASPGYMNPEGIVIFHTASSVCFKKTLVGDEKHKGE
jgi:hypothetical protein